MHNKLNGSHHRLPADEIDQNLAPSSQDVEMEVSVGQTRQDHDPAVEAF